MFGLDGFSVQVSPNSRATVLKRDIRKHKERKRISNLRVPDMRGRPAFTIQDVLDDGNIPRLRWESVVIGAVIGKGASGMISEGEWTKP